ncbi:hypothetical protein D3C71_1214190 [compost metagenome]
MGNRQRPRQDDQHAAQHRQPAEQQHLFPAFLHDDPRQYGDDRYRQCQKSFGHDAHATGQPQQQVAADFARTGVRLRGNPEAAHSGDQPEGDHRVQHGVSANTIDQQQGEENHARGQRYAFIAPDLPGQPDNQQRGQPGGKNRPGTHGKVRVAKQHLAEAVDPVSGNWFFKIAQPKEMRHHPVSSGQHFTADLRIARFIRLPEQADINGQQIVKRKQNEKSDTKTRRFHGAGLTVC